MGNASISTTITPFSPGSKAAGEISRCDFGQPRREEREGSGKDRIKMFLGAKVVNEVSALLKLLWYAGERKGEDRGREGGGREPIIK